MNVALRIMHYESCIINSPSATVSAALPADQKEKKRTKHKKIRRNQETMLKIVLIMLCGIGTGYLLRNKKMSFLGRIITALIWVLLFLLGIEVGSNPSIIGGIQTLGLEAVILTIGGSAGSVLFAWALWKYVTAKQMKSSGSADTEKGGKA